MPKLIIIRHGQSLWNLENRFTGEVDVDLTPTGEDEAKRAGLLLKNFSFDMAFTSVLRRAINTLNIILKEIDGKNIPIVKSPALNERNYGDLQGLNKKQVETEFGEKQFQLWRRSYHVAPPNGESLENTYNRVIPFYEKMILPNLKEGKNILIVAHGNSLRALMMYLENISPEEIPNITLPTGVPRLYQFNDSSELIKCYDIK